MDTLKEELASCKIFELEAQIKFQTLGQFLLYRNGEKVNAKEWGRDKTVQLTQYLISIRNRNAMHKEHIMEHLWEEGLDRDYKVPLHVVN